MSFLFLEDALVFPNPKSIQKFHIEEFDQLFPWLPLHSVRKCPNHGRLSEHCAALHSHECLASISTMVVNQCCFHVLLLLGTITPRGQMLSKHLTLINQCNRLNLKVHILHFSSLLFEMLISIKRHICGFKNQKPSQCSLSGSSLEVSRYQEVSEPIRREALSGSSDWLTVFWVH